MASPDRRPAPDSPDCVIRVNRPGELVVAVPFLLGFHPRESLVLVATGGPSGTRLGLALRVDLPPPEYADPVADTVADTLMCDAPTGAAVVVVGGRAGSDLPARALVDRVVDQLQRRHVDVHTVLWAAATTSGARWSCYDPCRCGGVLPDPATTAVAAAAVLAGRVVQADRSALARHVAPADAGRIRRREVLLTEAYDRAAAGDPPGDVAAGVATGDTAAGVAVVDAALADTADGRPDLDDGRVVALALALVAPSVRDAAVLRSAGPLAEAAEQLWAALAREMPDPEAAEPAALLAVSALLRGDGALAHVALDRAEQAWPGHRLTGLLRRCTDLGMRPSEFRACLGPGLRSGLGSIEDISPVSRSRAPARSARRPPPSR